MSLVDPAEYCRQVETYLCRKNDGHLIRIVGPAFEQVCGWAEQGIPLPITFRGIDQYCERYHARATRRRPVRIEFCAADVLELFDAWRRAVGVASASAPAAEAPARKPGLAAHIARAIERLVALRADQVPGELGAQVEATVRELDALREQAAQARGERRAALLGRLEALDGHLLDMAAAGLPAERRTSLARDAERDIAPFAARMPDDTRAASIRAAFLRLVREELRLPTIRFE